MYYIDTHTHLYLDDFAQDLPAIIDNALKNNVRKLLLPNIDLASLANMLDVCATYPEICYPMLGLHPTSVSADYINELEELKQKLQEHSYIAIGEIGIDLYWDTSLLTEQQKAFDIQIAWALERDVPIVIHMRNSFDALWDVLQAYKQIRGVFHCYSGTLEQAEMLVDNGFYLGIGGVVTYKKSDLPLVVQQVPLEKILLETDAPFLSPVPHRGKRNESAYLIHVAAKIAEIKNCSLEEVMHSTTENATKLFRL